MRTHLRNGVKQSFKALLAAASVQARCDWAQGNLGQVSTLSCALQWCADVHSALAAKQQASPSSASASSAECGGPLAPSRASSAHATHAALAGILQDTVAFIREVARVVGGEARPQQRQLLVSLLTSVVHQRDVTTLLHTTRCASPQAFTWQSQLRSVFRSLLVLRHGRCPACMLASHWQCQLELDRSGPCATALLLC